MNIFQFILALWAGGVIGVLLCIWIIPRLRNYSGIIIAKADETENKIVYSIVLFDNPENLIFQKEVLFKVQTSAEEDDRE